jgi:aflatoxin B1 aldehyde reductase
MQNTPVLGTMNINYLYSSANTNNTNVINSNTKNSTKNRELYQCIIETYLQRTGKHAILDSAYYYGNTTTEQTLGEILPSLSFIPKITTKVNPWYNNDFTNGKLGQLSKEGIQKQLTTSLNNLKVEQVEFLYLHCPDYETPIKTTLETCDMLWRREKYNHFGVSNFSLDQLKEILETSEHYGYNPPQYYQGMYNLISRKVEEIFPLLRENNIEFWAYNPLAGGLLTGKYKDFKNSYEINENADNSRFKNNQIYQSIFWKPEIINNSKIQEFFQLGNKKCIEYSYKWLQNYSKMDHTTDKIVIGCSSSEQLTNALDITQNERKKTVDTEIENERNEKNYLNKLYQDISQYSPNYWY